jgi:hypothetical protein
VLLIVTADADPYRSSRLTGRVTSEWASTGDIPAEWRSRCRRRGQPRPRAVSRSVTFDVFREDKHHLVRRWSAHVSGHASSRAGDALLLNTVLDRLPGLRLDPAAEDARPRTYRSGSTPPDLRRRTCPAEELASCSMGQGSPACLTCHSVWPCPFPLDIHAERTVVLAPGPTITVIEAVPGQPWRESLRLGRTASQRLLSMIVDCVGISAHMRSSG